MKLKGTLSDLSFLGKSLVFIGICLFMIGLCSGLAYYLSMAIFKINLLEKDLFALHGKNQNVINSFKLTQGFSAAGLFIFGPLLSVFLLEKNPSEYLKLNRRPSLQLCFVIFILMILNTPVINQLFYFNQQMALPAWMHSLEVWMKESEQQATLLTDAFLSTVSLNGLFFNLIVIALIPAIGEELLFRGLIQQWLQKTTGRKHLAVIVTAALFSAIHMQFYGFLPRMALGMLLGYAFLWSGSLWLSIIGHFTNNAIAVFFAFYAKKNGLPFNQDTVGTEKGDIWLLLISAFIVCAGLIYMHRNRIINPEKTHLSD
ncbi:MAG: CPBP family intramembrane glutamic endopeptidase [Bacteroidota bacterium]